MILISLMNGKLTIPRKFYVILFASLVAIFLVSFTVGREIYAGKTESIFSFGLIHFLGYLFFLLMPVEIAFVYYLSFYSEVLMVFAAMGTAIAAQCIDFYIGKLIRPKKIFDLMGRERMVKAERKVQRFGMLTIFFFNLLPLSSPIIALAAGMIKYDFKKFILVSSAGLYIKYLVLVWCFA